MQRFFEPTHDDMSFSYQVGRSAVVTVESSTTNLKEVNAVSSIHHAGKILGLTVIDQAVGPNPGLHARELTARWLGAFRQLNSPSVQ